MTLPQTIDARWIATLSDQQLARAEGQLRATFAKEDGAEKKRRGDRYSMMYWPAALTHAWIRWSLVCNESRARGLRTSYQQ